MSLQQLEEGRLLKMDPAAAALVIPGSMTLQGEPCGDSLLLDFRHSCFAVSDASGRSPGFSGRFLGEVADLLERTDIFTSGEICSTQELTRRLPELVTGLEEVMKRMNGSRSCTFTALIVVTGSSNRFGIILNSGDSMLFQVDGRTGRVGALHENNFWLVGRIDRLYQVDVIEIDEGSHFVLATDGFRELGNRRAESLEKLIAREFIRENPSRFIEWVLELAGSEETLDDCSLISLRIDGLEEQEGRFIMGCLPPGGEPGEESMEKKTGGEIRERPDIMYL